jgi:dihydropyrimidine dehydrogenase (NADP+)
LLYLKSITELEDWDGQSQPTPRHQLGKPIENIDGLKDKHLPNFGPFAQERKRIIAEYKRLNPPEERTPHKDHRPALQPTKPIPALSDKIGAAVPKIGSYGQLDNKQQKAQWREVCSFGATIKYMKYVRFIAILESACG